MNFSWEWGPQEFSVSEIFSVERILQKACKFLKKYSGNSREEDKSDYRIGEVVRKNWSEKNINTKSNVENKWNRKNKISDVLNTRASKYSFVVLSSASELILLHWCRYLSKKLLWNIMRSSERIDYPWICTSQY